MTHGVVLGAEVSPGFTKDELKEAHGVFQAEAKEIDPKYKPKTVNTDSFGLCQAGVWSCRSVTLYFWNTARSRWSLVLSSENTLSRSFGKQNRERSDHFAVYVVERKLGPRWNGTFLFELGGKVWDVYYPDTKRILGQRIRRLREWAKEHLSGVVQEKTLDLCDKQVEWSVWYEKDCENGYWTSNELDRSMHGAC